MTKLLRVKSYSGDRAHLVRSGKYNRPPFKAICGTHYPKDADDTGGSLCSRCERLAGRHPTETVG